MQRYLVEDMQIGTLYTNFPHTPDDLQASVQEYLEDKLANGYELVSMSSREGSSNEQVFIFKVVAK